MSFSRISCAFAIAALGAACGGHDFATASNDGATSGTRGGGGAAGGPEVASSSIGGTSNGQAGSGTGQGGSGGAESPCLPFATAGCYDGPAGTEGVGICASGMKTCLADGSAWGPCTGEVTPKVEDCSNLLDDDCNGVACSAPLWGMVYGDVSHQFGNAVAVDATGNVYFGGSFEGTMGIGNTTLISQGGMDLFVAKFDASGTLLWAKRFGDAANQGVSLLRLDPAGNIALAGSSSGALSFGGGSVLNPGQFVAKLTPSGDFVWGKSFNTGSITGLAVAPNGNFVVAGWFMTSINFGGGTLLTAGDADIFVAELTGGSGAHVWSKRFGGPNWQAAYDVATDPAGNILIAGEITGTAQIGPFTLQSAGATDALVFRLDSNGNPSWATRFGDAKAQSTYAIAVDGVGSAVLTGSFDGTLSFGGVSLVGAGSEDVFVAKLSSGGVPLWAVRAGDGSAQRGTSIALDSSGNALVSGFFQGTANFGGGPLVSAGGYDLFLAKLEPDGTHLWSKRFGDAADQTSAHVAADPTSSAVLFAGTTQGALNFGAGSLPYAGSDDAFVAKFAP